MSPTQRNSMVWLLGVVLTLFYGYLSLHIDFHPDEAIYFDAIPLSVRNDAGAFYSAFYLLVTHWFAGPEGARLASAILGGATFLVLARIIGLFRPLSASSIIVLFAVFALSYQAIFVFVRVRPEAAWWFCSVLVMYAIAQFETTDRSRLVVSGAFATLLFTLLLLPMNHRLSWFACAFVAGYALLFLWREKGWRVVVAVWSFLFIGVILNIVLQAWWVGMPLHQAFSSAMNSPGGHRQPVGEFFKYVFYGTPVFLNDTAQNANFYEWVSGSKAGWMSHAFVQNALWLSMFVLPFIGRTWKEAYIFAFPLFAFCAFWFSGYYNPTYAAGFSLFCTMAFAYVALGAPGWRKTLAVVVIVISVVNGFSFVATRVLNHGDATYFGAEQAVRQMAEQMPAGQTIAVPERFIPAVSGLPLHYYVDLKMDIPSDVDVLVTDSYDSLMYGFVPDFEAKKKALAQLAGKMCMVERIESPVYQGDTLFGGSISKTLQIPGSWFFRNSAAYALNIYRKCDIRDDKQ